MDWIKQAQDLGAGEIVLNVMNADGTTSGYDLEMTAAVSAAVKIPVVASGGGGHPQHHLPGPNPRPAHAALAPPPFHLGPTTRARGQTVSPAPPVPVRRRQL